MRIDYQYLLALLAGLSAISAVMAGDDSKDAKKSKGLQIGVKKRVDPDKCPIKSRKGDTLHMHYTVSILCISTF
jgi:FK506-binding protein 2